MGVVGNVEPNDLEALDSILPSANVDQLVMMPMEDLRFTLAVCRDLYREGHAMTRLAQGHKQSRIEIVREILSLRAYSLSLDPRTRRGLSVGHTAEWGHFVTSEESTT